MASSPLAECSSSSNNGTITKSPLAVGGAKKRTGIPMLRNATTIQQQQQSRVPQQPADLRRVIDEDGLDSGLSSECTTPTNGSPPPRQPNCAEQRPRQSIQPLAAGHIPRRKMVDIIAASKARLQQAEERLCNNRSRLLHNRSNTDSPRSVDSTRSRQVFSPLRTPRNVQSPSLDSGDEGSLRIERGTYGYMFQDIVSIKTMLLKLKRVLQESGENGLTRSEPLNPFDTSLKNGLFYNLNDGSATTTSTTTTDDSLNSDDNGGRETIVEELADLRRQVVILQSQNDEKDRTITELQEQLAKYQKTTEVANGVATIELNGKDELPTTNAATQTDRLRPLSTGSSLLQDHGSGSLVSSNDSWLSDHPRPSTLALDQYHHHPQQISPITCNGNNSRSSSRRTSEQQRPSRLRPPSISGNCPPTSEPATRTSIPTPRQLAAALLPSNRTARAVSATGRPQNS